MAEEVEEEVDLIPPAGRHECDWLQARLPLTTPAAVHQASAICRRAVCEFLPHTFVYVHVMAFWLIQFVAFISFAIAVIHAELSLMHAFD